MSKTAWLVAPAGSIEAPATIKVPLTKSLLVILPILFFQSDRIQKSAIHGDDFQILDDEAASAAIRDANEIEAVSLTDSEFNELMAFLQALTDPASVDLRQDVPKTVPSGLPVFD